MNKFSYTFDFGKKPAFVIDAWFKRSLGPMLLISAILFPMCATRCDWLTRYVFPSIAAGAIILYLGVYIFRRQLAVRRVRKIKNTVFSYEINETGIQFDNDIGSGVIKWGFKGRLIPLKNFILLQSNEMGLIPLPLDTPAETIAFIKDQLR